ncbi:hypothetical protein [Nocardia sp. NPDC004123]
MSHRADRLFPPTSDYDKEEACVDRSSTDASGRTRRIGPDTQLKVQLRQRHWQTHRVFLREYDKAAARLDPDLVGSGPLKAQFYRWLAGDLKTLPYPDHCRVLEEMLPGYTAGELFEPVARPRPIRPADPDRLLRVSPLSGDSNESPDSVVGSGGKPSQQEITAAIDTRMRSLMSWISETAPLKERDIHRDYGHGPSVEAPAHLAVDRRRSR